MRSQIAELIKDTKSLARKQPKREPRLVDPPPYLRSMYVAVIRSVIHGL